jgi:hypothetical protein
MKKIFFSCIIGLRISFFLQGINRMTYYIFSIEKNKSHDDFLTYFKNIPSETQRLHLMNNWFLGKNLETIEKALSFLNTKHITEIILSKNNFFRYSSTEYFQKIMAQLPRSTHHLDLSLNELWQFPFYTLKKIFSELPPNITSLNLSMNHLGQIAFEELVEILSSLSSEITEINLSHNSFDTLSECEYSNLLLKLPHKIHTLTLSLDATRDPSKLERLIENLPINIEKMHLIDCRLAYIPIKKIKTILKKLPLSLKKLDLSMNDLLYHHTDETILDILLALPQHLCELRLLDDDSPYAEIQYPQKLMMIIRELFFHDRFMLASSLLSHIHVTGLDPLKKRVATEQWLRINRIIMDAYIHTKMLIEECLLPSNKAFSHRFFQSYEDNNLLYFQEEMKMGNIVKGLFLKYRFLMLIQLLSEMRISTLKHKIALEMLVFFGNFIYKYQNQKKQLERTFLSTEQVLLNQEYPYFNRYCKKIHCIEMRPTPSADLTLYI